MDMIKEHEEDLCEFLKNDEKGRYVIPFLSGLSDQLKNDKKSQIIELESLSDNIEHIKNIVTMQQSYTGNVGVIENLQVSLIMEDAININLPSMKKRGIKLTRHYKNDPVIAVDKHKLMQILVNLVSNAAHAVDNNEVDKMVSVGINTRDEWVFMYVEDNGVGIESRDIERLFEFGFKKRVGGHGYGLHHSAIMAKELGGKITVSSDGLGKGAKFEVSIPVQ